MVVNCGKDCRAELPLGDALAALPRGEWTRLGIQLRCLRVAGADTARLETPFSLHSGSGMRVSLAHVAAGTEFDHRLECPLQ